MRISSANKQVFRCFGAPSSRHPPTLFQPTVPDCCNRLLLPGGHSNAQLSNALLRTCNMYMLLNMIALAAAGKSSCHALGKRIDAMLHMLY